MAEIARRFFRVVEGDDGRWACRVGRREMDSHDAFTEAIRHILFIAGGRRPSQVFVHHADGRVRTEAVLD